MTMRAYYRINDPTVSHQILDGEAIIINLESGNYYSLDRLGADVWTAIGENVASDGIVERLIRRCGGDRVVIDKAVAELLTDLEKESLIVPDEARKLEGARAFDGLVEPEAEAVKVGFEAPKLQKYTDMQELLLLDPIHEVDEAGWPQMVSEDSLP